MAIFSHESTPVILQVSPRKYSVVMIQKGNGTFQAFYNGVASGRFYGYQTGDTVFTGNHADCMLWIAENTEQVDKPEANRIRQSFPFSG